jgi:hypothetical protein
MSELTVGSISGLAVNNFLVGVEAGSKIIQPGTPVKVQTFVNSTRLAYSASSSYITFWNSIQFQKQIPNSDILIVGYFQFRGGWQFATNFRATINGVNYDAVAGYSDNLEGSTYQDITTKVSTVHFSVPSLAAGLLNISFSRGNVDSAFTPAGQFNPSTSDDSRFPQTKSIITVMEIAS